MNIINNFEKIKQEIKVNRAQKETEIIAVSKTFPIEHIMPLVDHGHRHFGETVSYTHLTLPTILLV